MPLAATVEPVPLTTDADGVIRVGGTRVTLDTVIAAYKKGSTPEQIAQDYSSLDPADIYAVITYFLRHRAEIEAYLTERRLKAEAVRRKFQKLFPSRDLRRRLQSRLS